MTKWIGLFGLYILGGQIVYIIASIIVFSILCHRYGLDLANEAVHHVQRGNWKAAPINVLLWPYIAPKNAIETYHELTDICCELLMKKD